MALRKQMQRSPSIISYFEEADWSNSYSEESSSENVGGIGSSSNSEDTSNSQTSTNHHQDEIRRLIQNETKGVIMWRYVVTAIMVITACFVSVSTYIFLSREETDTFERGFEDVAVRATDVTRMNMATLFESFKGLSCVVTSFGNGAWPLVTIPDFTTHGDHVRDATGASAIWWAPLVPLEQKAAWEIHAETLSDTPIFPNIYEIRNRTVSPSSGPGPFCPVAQMDPPSEEIQIVYSPVNYDLLSESFFKDTISTVDSIGEGVLSDFATLSLFRRAIDISADDLASLLVLPIFNEAEQKGGVVGYLQGFVSWTAMFSNILSDETEGGIHCVLNNVCRGINKNFSFYISANETTLVGEGALFPSKYESHKVSASLTEYEDAAAAMQAGACRYSIDLYPSTEMRESYENSNPEFFTTVVALVFFFMIFAFFAYEWFVQRRNDKVVETAARSNAIVSSMFPGKMRDRILAGEETVGGKARPSWLTPKAGLKNYLEDGEKDESRAYDSKPLADLFPETTILFADIVGFTAWSSVREPSQVFTLLETIFRSFDELARRRRIFKVETVGDCYVAVSGLPEPRKDHAVVMAKFADECMHKIHQVTKHMEVRLGPDTGDLTIRVGLHSGPVTAGVLRGDRARFQLFGDTMNTAARMEHTGKPDKIQVSQETSDLLIAAGKSHWITPREDAVYAKGKGEMNTYWLLNTTSKSSNSNNDSTESSRVYSDDEDSLVDGMGPDVHRLMGRTKRLVEWNVEVLGSLLKKIYARHVHSKRRESAKPTMPSRPAGTTVLDEVKEIIALPDFDADADRRQQGADSVDLPDSVLEQLYDYCSNIAALYHENPFHNFEHASHVAMSASKLLGRIVAPSDVLTQMGNKTSDANHIASSLHDHTYGITSDPLTQFACVFSALIHDVDHQGVPNTQLVKENASIAMLYKNKSVAEQNSIDLAWDLLMASEFDALRTVLCPTQEEFVRFRQLVINAVLATDIMDKDLKNLRNARWEKAFDENRVDDNERDSVNRKATIVIEHLIQASDVAHTMQHWHIYRKWNERLFRENYQAFLEGRAEKDPSDGWYQGEIGFFDFYIIPLAKKLKNCGVFGVSSDEYLNYAEKNRKEWEARGQEVVAEMVESVKEEIVDATMSSPEQD